MSARNVGDEIITGLENAVAYAKGDQAIATTVREIHVPDAIDVKAVRQQLGLSQEKFANRYGFKVSALRDWEQGRRRPERTARILLTVIAKNPAAVDDALAVN